MERWMISEVWRELKNVARELGRLVVTLLPWLPVFGLAIWGVERFGWQAAPVIVLLTPWYRWLLRGGRPPVRRRVRDVVLWLLVAGIAAAVLRVAGTPLPAYVSGPVLALAALIVQAAR